MKKALFFLGIIFILALFFGCTNLSAPPQSANNATQDNFITPPSFDQNQSPSQQSEQPPTQQPELNLDEVNVSSTGSTYSIASTRPAGWFTNAQEADILLSGIGFDNTGGSLLFNHPGNIASDKTHLILAERNNNRILIWNTLPMGNTPPDLVLGQNNFISNNPGTGLDQLNWPVSVSTGGGKLVVADTYNNRILIWNTFPTRNGQPADLAINNGSDTHDGKFKRNIIWPWGVWTDGTKLIITSTRGSLALLWNNFPTKNDQSADIYLTAGGKFGTPRTITSNGNSLIIGDHNPKTSEEFSDRPREQGNFFWKTWPIADDTPNDFFMSDPLDAGGAWMQGDFTADGKLILLGAANLYIWDSFPQSATDSPSLTIGNARGGGPNQQITTGYHFFGGDGSGTAVAGNKLYISLSNGNKIVTYNSIPKTKEAMPDFAIGSPDIITNTLDTNFIVSNPLPATDGKSLFVSSDFDRKLYVWKNLPNENGAHPDFVYSLPSEPWDNEVFGDILVLVGKKSVYIWKNLPLNGEKPQTIFKDSIGNIQFNELYGVALDETYFYLSDWGANKIYVWEGIPNQNSEPKFILNAEHTGRLSSDGAYLVSTATDLSQIRVYPIKDLSSTLQPKLIGGEGTPASTHTYNLAQSAIVFDEKLFIAGTNSNKVYIWKNILDATSGKDADVILGTQSNNFDDPPKIGKNTFFWPAGLAFDGSYLWVGEFKFSERLLRFSIK